MIKTTLPVGSAERKDAPLFSGVRRYAPAAFMLMAEVSKAGNEKHNPGQPLHHARGKSADHGDCVDRHLSDIQDIEAAFERGAPQSPENLKQLRDELGQFAWRANLYVQEMAEKYLGAPLAPGARLPAPLIDYSHEIPLIDATDGTPLDPLHGPAGADWRERGIARDDHGGNAKC